MSKSSIPKTHIKPIPKISSHRNGRIGSQKNEYRTPKGVIHVQASFNNTIVTIIDARGWVVSWVSMLVHQEYV